MKPLLFALWLALGLAFGADGGVDPVLSGPPIIEDAVPGTPPPADQIDLVARRIGLGLRCPVCQGLSVADSTAPTAVTMQRRIRDFVAAGYSQDDINTYFASKYGEWVLLNPTNEGLNLLVWLGPLLAFGLGLTAAITFLRKGTEDLERADEPFDVDDPYTAQLLAEIDDD